MSDDAIRDQISPFVRELGLTADTVVRDQWNQIDRIQRAVVNKVVSAFVRHRVGAAALDYSTGYGCGSQAREIVDLVWADALDAQSAVVRPQIVTGTHALFICLRAVLRPGHTLLSITGTPYGTLVTGLRGTDNVEGLLQARDITYHEIDPFTDGGLDHSLLAPARLPAADLVLIQRSRGYADRPALTIDQIGAVITAVKRGIPQAVVLVDNCYGEFVEEREPSAVGADIVAGSLLKNPGAGLAPTGGYIAGNKDLVERAAWELTSPGQGREVGPLLDAHRWLLQGLFTAPHVVAEGLKSAVWGSWLAERLGIGVSPVWNERRGDIVQTLSLASQDAVLSFCRGVQSAGPLDSSVVPIGAPYPGLDCDVVMAGGTFVQGSSIELSADAPLAPPYTVFIQGGLYVEHARLGYELGLSQLIADGLLKLN